MRIGELAVVAILALPTIGKGQVALPERHLVEELRLDAKRENFPELGYFLVGPHGQIIVPDDGRQELRFYDANGMLTGTFGRKGSGPGEFRSMTAVGWIGDTLLVYDVNQFRLTYVSPAAKLLRVSVIAMKLSEEATTGGRRDIAGRLQMFFPRGQTPSGLLIGGAVFTKGWTAEGRPITLSYAVLADRDGGVRKRIAAFPKGDGTSVYATDHGKDGFSRVVPFATDPVWSWAPDGNRFGLLRTEVSSMGGSYTVTVIKTAGDTAFSRSYPFAAERIPKAAIDSALAAVDNQQPPYPGSVAGELKRLMLPKIPPIYSPVRFLTVGNDNSVWIWLRRTTPQWQYLVLDKRGQPIARVTLPKGSRLGPASLDRIWVIETDDDDLTSIVRYRLK